MTLVLARTEYWDLWPGTVTTLALFVMPVISLVHAFKARKRYLLLLAVRQSLREAERAAGAPAETAGVAWCEEETTSSQAPAASLAPPEPGTGHETDGEGEVFRLAARASYLIATNAGGLVLGAVLLLFLTYIRTIFSPWLYLCSSSSSPCTWALTWSSGGAGGIRAIEVDAAGITIYRGPAAKPARIPASAITGVDVFNKLGRKIANILTGGTATRMPGITLFSGPRIRVTEDAFNSHEFEVFIEKIKALAGQGND